MEVDELPAFLLDPDAEEAAGPAGGQEEAAPAPPPPPARVRGHRPKGVPNTDAANLRHRQGLAERDKRREQQRAQDLDPLLRPDFAARQSRVALELESADSVRHVMFDGEIMVAPRRRTRTSEFRRITRLGEQRNS